MPSVSYTQTHLCIYINIHICIKWVCVCMYIHVYIYIYMYILICIYLYVYIYICIYLYVYTYINMYIYTRTCHNKPSTRWCRPSSRSWSKSNETQICQKRLVYVRLDKQKRPIPVKRDQFFWKTTLERDIRLTHGWKMTIFCIGCVLIHTLISIFSIHKLISIYSIRRLVSLFPLYLSVFCLSLSLFISLSLSFYQKKSGDT